MNKEIEQFIAAIKENASNIWNKPDDKDFIDGLICVVKLKDGSTSICDNYERFFHAIYRIDEQGNWYIRYMYSEKPERPYSFVQAMRDAKIIYTG